MNALSASRYTDAAKTMFEAACSAAQRAPITKRL
jgi:hypothetical protein